MLGTLRETASTVMLPITPNKNGANTFLVNPKLNFFSLFLNSL